jgi:MFS family permease
VLLAAFVLAERRASHPLLPLRVLVSRSRGGSYVALFISGVAIFGTFLFLTYYLQLIKGESPLTTGLLFLPMIGCILISSNLASIVLLPRAGPRVLVAAGMLLASGGMVYLTQVSVTSSYAGGVLPALLILGLGFGMVFAPAINTATTGVSREDSGVASALVNTMQQVGGSIGTSALSTIALTATASYLVAHHASPLAPAIAATHGYTLAFAISAGLLGLGCILTIVLVPSRRRLAELRTVSAAVARPGPSLAPGPARPAPVPAPDRVQPVEQGFEAIPVALCSCSPVVTHAPESEATSIR